MGRLTEYIKEFEREAAIRDIEHIKNCKKDNPSIRVRNRDISLTKTEKEKICDYIISILKKDKR